VPVGELPNPSLCEERFLLVPLKHHQSDLFHYRIKIEILSAFAMYRRLSCQRVFSWHPENRSDFPGG